MCGHADTLGYVKHLITEEGKLQSCQIRMMYIGRQLKDKTLVDDLNLGKNDVLQVLCCAVCAVRAALLGDYNVKMNSS